MTITSCGLMCLQDPFAPLTVAFLRHCFPLRVLPLSKIIKRRTWRSFFCTISWGGPQLAQIAAQILIFCARWAQCRRIPARIPAFRYRGGHRPYAQLPQLGRDHNSAEQPGRDYRSLATISAACHSHHSLVQSPQFTTGRRRWPRSALRASGCRCWPAGAAARRIPGPRKCVLPPASCHIRAASCGR